MQIFIIIILDVLLSFSFILGYYVPSAAKFSKRGNKYDNAELRELKKRMGIDANVYVINSPNLGLNAYQIGGRGKYVLLSSKLLENLNDKEIIAVIAHEFAHIKLRHVLKNQVSVYLILVLGINSLFVFNSLLYSAIILSSIVPIALGVNIFLKRKFDYEADSYAAKFVDRKYLISSLKKINSFILPQCLDKDGVMHPLIEKRIEKLQKFKS